MKSWGDDFPISSCVPPSLEASVSELVPWVFESKRFKCVGGLLAYGLTHISTDTLSGWQWLYIVEGLFTVALAPVAYFWIPNRIDQAWFLNRDEKDMCTVRYETNMTHYDPDEEFDIQVVLLAFKDWRTWASGVIQFGADITLYAISTFM